MKQTHLCFLSCLLFLVGGAAFAEEKCCWINAKTGEPYPSSRLVPLGMKPIDFEADPNHFRVPDAGGHLHGNWVRVPCPPPETAGHAIRNILQSVSVGVGVNGGHTIGHNDHNGDHHISDKKHTTSSATSKKTVTSACKCHPCTCSPCTCH